MNYSAVKLGFESIINFSWSINTWGLEAKDDSVFKTGTPCLFNACANRLGYLIWFPLSNCNSNLKPLYVKLSWVCAISCDWLFNKFISSFIVINGKSWSSEHCWIKTSKTLSKFKADPNNEPKEAAVTVNPFITTLLVFKRVCNKSDVAPIVSIIPVVNGGKPKGGIPVAG